MRFRQQDRVGHGWCLHVQVTQSLPDIAFLNCRPSVIAAAIVYAERRSRGIIPFWPSMLSKLSAYQVALPASSCCFMSPPPYAPRYSSASRPSGKA